GTGGDSRVKACTAGVSTPAATVEATGSMDLCLRITAHTCAAGRYPSRPKDSTPSEYGWSLLHRGISVLRMTALGHQQTRRRHGAMSALPLKADKAPTCWHVRFVPIAS